MEKYSLDHRLVPVTELCDVERAKAGKTYPAGTCYVTLSGTNDTVMRLTEAGEIETRYAAIVPHDDTDHAYLFAVLQMAFPRWFTAHRTGINLQFKELSTLKVEWHTDEATRRMLDAKCSDLDREAEQIERKIAALEELKRYLTGKMFVTTPQEVRDHRGRADIDAILRELEDILG